MTADQVIELRKVWGKYNFADVLPEATVLAEHDWLAYVQAMTAMVPRGESITYPSEDDINWSWPEGVLVVMSEPLELSHNIVSKGTPDGGSQMVDPHQEKQTCAALMVGRLRMIQTMTPDGQRHEDMSAYPVLWIGTDPHDIVTGYWMPGGSAMALSEHGISESSRFLLSLIAALGHRLTKYAVPSFNGRGEKRRTTRELPSLRVLQLSSGATVTKSEDDPSKVEWSHRWMVRGHWRLQACGPQHKLRRMTWIDPYVKGPDDKPLDVRPTIWRTSDKVPEGRL